MTRFQTDAPMGPFMFDELSVFFKKQVGLILKMPLTMHDQLLACRMRNGFKIQKINSNLVWVTLEQERKLFLPLRKLPLKKD